MMILGLQCDDDDGGGGGGGGDDDNDAAAIRVTAATIVPCVSTAGDMGVMQDGSPWF